MATDEWSCIHAHILELEASGLVTRTFRRLDPGRQQTVLAAILDEATEKGPTAINIKQVASRAGVSVGALYTYFGNRDGLIGFAVELCRHFMSDAFRDFAPMLAAMPVDEALTGYLAGGIEWSQAQAGLVQFFARAAYQGDPALSERIVRPIASTIREMVRAILEAGIARGELRDDLDVDAATRIIHALMLAVGDAVLLPYLNTYFQVESDEVDFGRIMRTLVPMILHGIARDGPGSARPDEAADVPQPVVGRLE